MTSRHHLNALYSLAAGLVVHLCFLPMSMAFVCSRVQDGGIGDENACTSAIQSASIACGSDSTLECPNPSVSWFSRNLSYSIYELPPKGTSIDQLINDINTSFAAWTNIQEQFSQQDCTYSSDFSDSDIAFSPPATTTSSTYVGYNPALGANNNNLLIFHADSWDTSLSNVVAFTRLTVIANTGEILDADIEFNAQNHVFTNSTSSQPTTDIINTAVHEIGHLLGLGHANSMQATMYYSEQAGETGKRDLACDDIKGIGFKYPEEGDNRYCNPSSNLCGCCTEPENLSTATVEVSVQTTDDGLNDPQGGCQQMPTPFWAFMTLAPFWSRRHRHHRHPDA